MSTTSSPPNPSLSYRSFLGVAVFVFLGLLATAGFKSYRDLALSRAEETSLEERIDETRQRIDEVQHHLDRLENDPLLLERLAREELGMVRAGDVVIVLPDPPTLEGGSEQPTVFRQP